MNLAMLAKQLWRIWCHLDKLLSRVLPARYFPHGDVLSVQLETLPSLTWPSLMAAQYLFRAGCRWRVGSGSHIRVWTDLWIPRAHSFKPIMPVPPILINLRVVDLIDPACSEWRREQVEEIFLPQDNEYILSIPLSRVGEEDWLVWHYSNNERFSIRSAYYLACSLEDRPCSSSLEADESP
ncbi:UNVERIFIED_CONTAM: hypothetical protein Slati_3005000 [Sesamum latifolium]|uniref:Uncharacterized protein n=1 Tax=Sesamum latifolium TaxID=2727402 RepID=A0AAW2VGI1_9LAMI